MGAAFALMLNAFVWGVSWIPFRQLAAWGWHPLWSTAIVYTAIAIPMLLLRRRQMTGFFSGSALLVLALSAGLTNVGFNWAVTTGDVVRVVLLFYLMPLWSVLLAWWLLDERPDIGGIGRMVLALVGVAIVLKRPGMDWPVPASLPDWLGLGAGFCFALTNILLRRAAHASGEMRALAMFIGCGVVAWLASLVGSGLGLLPGPDLSTLGWLPWALLLGAGFIAANVGLQYGVVRLATSTVALIMLSEVLFASTSSVLLGAAVFDVRIAIGGALILASALWAACRRRPRVPVH